MSEPQAAPPTKVAFFSRPQFKTAILRAGVLLGFHLLLGALFILLFSGWNQWGGWKYRLLFVAFHWVINAGLWLPVFLSCGLLLQAERAWLRRVATLVPSGVFVLLLMLWLIDWMTTLHWGGNVSDRLMWEIVRHLPEYAKLLPFVVYGVLLAGIVLVFVLYHRLAGRAIESFGEITWLLRGRRGFAILSGAVAIYVLLFALLWHPWMVRWNFWQREPLVSFFLLSRGHLLFPDQAQAFLPPTPRRLQSAERDKQIRQSYPRPSFHKRNVILITVDSWRADHLPVYGYSRQTSPFLSKLQAEGRLRKVAEARATCNATYCAVLSILASRNVPDLGNGLFQLQDLLKAQSYEIHFLLSGIHTAWYDLRRLYGESVDKYFDGTLARNYVANDDRGVIERLQQTKPYTGQPAFFYFHLMAPHLVGVRLPEYAEWQPTTSKLRVLNDLTTNLNTYDQGVRMADAMIEKIFAELDAKGYLRDSIIVLLGDHGEALGEHQHFSHGLSLYDEDIRIPLLIVDEPGVEYRNLSSALQLDVAPTIVDRLGLPVPSSWQGKSLLRAQPHTTSFHQAGFQPQQALIHREGPNVWKYILNTKTGAEELYELRRDPEEARNLVQAQEVSAILPRLRTLLSQQ